jgi:hypothetical protein
MDDTTRPPALDQPLVGVTLLMADAVQVSGGKLHVLGGGLSAIGPDPQQAAVAVLMLIPWDRANIAHQWRLEVLDEDGVPVMAGDRPMGVSGTVEAGRPAGALPGAPLPVPIAINFPQLRLPGGRSYIFRLSVDETTQPHWSVRITARDQVPGAAPS